MIKLIITWNRKSELKDGDVAALEFLLAPSDKSTFLCVVAEDEEQAQIIGSTIQDLIKKDTR